MRIERGLGQDGQACYYVQTDGRCRLFEPASGLTDQEVVITQNLRLEPTKIVAVGLNYRDHAAEMKLDLPATPVIFMKPATTVIGPDEAIVYPEGVTRLDYEAELGVVIAKTCRKVSRAQAREFILGYTCVNDVTARDLQPLDGQWTRAKSYDTFCPLGPWIETVLDPTRLKIEAFLNGELRQCSNTANLIFDVFTLVEFISNIMTLNPGDVIATGTPAGIGPMQVGDEIEIAIEGLGRLRNRVAR
ncbi:MAG: Ureidoglycolate lyase [Deltaproteobacteria bacterium ADurb.Bin510]|nr:MAG: Ureidoglycolate lyase [Deltaproteobacteria bacterium ADurb.Bin510]